MNLTGLELVEIEYNGEHNCSVLRFKSKDANVQVVTKDVDNALIFADKLQDKKAEIELRLPSSNHPYSTTSQRYCWALINRLANAQRRSKDEVYLELIRQYTETAWQSVPKEDFDSGKWKKLAGVIDYKVMGEGKIGDKLFVHILMYAGMSKMEQAELNQFIDCIKAECHELGIDTTSPSEMRLYG